MTEVSPNKRVLPAVVKAFAAHRVMRGLRPDMRGSSKHLSAQAIGQLMQAVAKRDAQRTTL